MIVTVTPTVMDGTVVRWYHDADRLDDLDAIRPMLSASRNGVMVGTYLHQVPTVLLAAAQDAYETLRRDRGADLRHLATHRSKAMFGPLEPVTPPDPS